MEGGRAGGGTAVPPQHWEMSAGRASGGQGRPPPQPRLSCLALCTSSPRAARSSAQSRNVSEPTPACPPPVSPGASGEPGGVQGPGRGQAQATPLVKAGGEPLPSARVPVPPSLAVETRPQGGAPRGSQSGAAACYPPAGIPLAIPDEGAEALQGAQRPRSLATPETGSCAGCALHDSRSHAHCTHRGGACLLTPFLAGGSHSNPGQPLGLSFPIYSVDVGTYAGGHQGAASSRGHRSGGGREIAASQGPSAARGTADTPSSVGPTSPTPLSASARGPLLIPHPYALWAQPALLLWLPPRPTGTCSDLQTRQPGCAPSPLLGPPPGPLLSRGKW